ncbi:hypothetical protein LguiA_036414 [Lonicera macranthoides]
MGWKRRFCTMRKVQREKWVGRDALHHEEQEEEGNIEAMPSPLSKAMPSHSSVSYRKFNDLELMEEMFMNIPRKLILCKSSTHSNGMDIKEPR